MMPDNQTDRRELPEKWGAVTQPIYARHACRLHRHLLRAGDARAVFPSTRIVRRAVLDAVAGPASRLRLSRIWRCPPGARAAWGAFRSNDPRFPLTGIGTLPLRETPATAPNRVALGVVGLLLLGIILGVLLAIASDAHEPALLAGVLIAGIAGVLLALDGAVVAMQRAPIPAWRWIRIPVQSRRAPRGTPLALAGIATALWALLILAYAGLVIGAVGMALLLIACVLAAPLTRRVAWRQSPPRYRFPADDDGHGSEYRDE